ncbi:MAG: DUF3088 family protein [Alphaproteobacteria bacterium]|nr:DUF3088 family protein [Alphaproteobacteria bacterium]
MAKDQLFLLAAPFVDAKLGEAQWFCPHCAVVEIALQLNPHWAAQVKVKRVAFPRPRAEVVALVGEAEQSLPTLVFADPATAPQGARTANGHAFLKGGAEIAIALAARYGGVAPHP